MKCIFGRGSGEEEADKEEWWLTAVQLTNTQSQKAARPTTKRSRCPSGKIRSERQKGGEKEENIAVVKAFFFVPSMLAENLKLKTEHRS